MSGAQTLVTEPDTGYELSVVDLGLLRAAICAVGEFDIAARDDLAEVLQDQEDEDRRFVRLDLSQVSFLDCSCLRVLVAAHHRFLEIHGLLVLSGVDENVARILKLTGLDDSLFIVPASQDPFGPVLVARAARRRRVPKQQRTAMESFDGLMAVADQLDPAGDQVPELPAQPSLEPVAPIGAVEETPIELRDAGVPLDLGRPSMGYGLDEVPEQHLEIFEEMLPATRALYRQA